MPIPSIPSGGFIDCSSNILVAEQLLAILGGNRTFINSGVDQLKSNINALVTAGALGQTDDVLNKAEKIKNSKKKYIPDYTDKANNAGEALDQYDRDLYGFQEMVRKCPSSQVKSFVNLLGLGVLLPTVEDTMLARTGYSSLRQAMNKIDTFPGAYLRSKRNEILGKTAGRMLDDVDRVNDFVVGNTLDTMESLMPTMVTQLANQIEMLLICVERLACSSVAPLKLQYSQTMQSMPLNPAFDINLTDKLRPVPDYKLDSQNIYGTTTASPQQQTNLGVARDSVKDAMGYARGMTDKYFTIR